MTRQAVILAGGKGTRLRARLGDLPKPLVSVCGVPLLERQIITLRDQGYGDVILLVNHRADRIVEYCRSRDDFGIRLRVVDDGEPRGTAGALIAVLDDLAPEFLVVYGDTLFDVHLARFEAFHREVSDAAATLFLHPNDHPFDSDLVELDDAGFVTAFHPVPHPNGAYLQNLVNAALYLMRRDHLATHRDLPVPSDIARDLFPRMLAAGTKLRGYISPEYIKDAGTPERLDAVCRAVQAGAVERASLRHPQRAVFLDRDGTLNEHRGYVTRPEQLETFPFAGPALRRLNREGWRSVVVTNQPVLARGDCTARELRDIHAKLDTELARHGAFVDRYYVCPHHPHAGFDGEVRALKIDCSCRKPKPGLLLRAAEELNVDLAASWMIGDGSGDAGAALAAGVSSIGVETGEAGLDDRTPFEAEFLQPDVAAAVEFIIDTYPRLASTVRPLAAELRPGDDWFVGGLSRAGKSTLAATLKREARALGRRCEVVSLDRWILDEPSRGPDVLGRFDLRAIEAAVRVAADRKQGAVELRVPAYSRRKRRRTEHSARIRLEPDTIVIWDGVVARHVARLIGEHDRTIFVTTDEAGRRERVVRTYCVRGYARSEAERIFTSREADEHDVVRASSAGAAHRLCLDAILSPPPIEAGVKR